MGKMLRHTVSTPDLLCRRYFGGCVPPLPPVLDAPRLLHSPSEELDRRGSPGAQCVHIRNVNEYSECK